MKNASHSRPMPNPDPANLSQAELSSNQDSKVVPWVAGERKCAVLWVTGILNSFTKDSSVTGKKS